MAIIDFKDFLEMVEWVVFRLFLLITFVGGVYKVLDKEFHIRKSIRRWRKRKAENGQLKSES